MYSLIILSAVVYGLIATTTFISLACLQKGGANMVIVNMDRQAMAALYINLPPRARERRISLF